MKSYLMHHGILGQKWGVRRFQNSDGTYTEAGKKLYSKSGKLASSIHDKASKIEPVITNDVTSAIEGSGAKMYGLDHTTKEFKSNVQKNVEKTRYNLETAQRERAKSAKSNFDKVESEYMNAHSRAKEQEATANAMEFIRKNRNNKYDAISRSKAQDLMKKYNISEDISDDVLKSRSSLHRKAAGNLNQKQRSMSERYNQALAEYMKASGNDEKNKRKREKLQRIMQEAVREMQRS